MPLELLQKGLGWLCVFPSAKADSTIDKIARVVFTIIVFFANLCALLASATFVYKFISTDMQRSLYALLQMGSFFIMTYTIVVAFFVRDKIIGIFEKLSEIYRASMT